MNFIAKLATATAAFAAVTALAPTEGYAQSKPVVKLCTGGQGGAYNAGGKVLTAENPLVSVEEVLPTPTESCYDKLRSGEVDAILAQGDAALANKNSGKSIPTTNIMPLAQETGLLICTTDFVEQSGIGRLPNLRSESVRGQSFSLAVGSGAKTTLNNLIRADNGYRPLYNPTDPTNSPSIIMGTTDALDAVQSGNAKCAFVVISQGAKALKDMEENFGDVLRIVRSSDRDLLNIEYDGKPVYEDVTISRKTFPRLTDGSDVYAFGVTSLLVASTKAFENRPDDLKAFRQWAGSKRQAVIKEMVSPR